MEARAAARDESVEDGAALGIPAEMVAHIRRVAAPARNDAAVGDVLVWPCNVPIVTLFQMMQTQWRMSATGSCGLDYRVLGGVARACGIDPDRAWLLLPGLRIMEDETLVAWDERRAEAAR